MAQVEPLEIEQSPAYNAPPSVIVTPFNPLTTLIRRLEAATSRLEDIAASANTSEPTRDVSPSFTPAAGSVPTHSSAPELPGLVRDASMSTPATPRPAQVPERIQAMDELLGSDLGAFVAASKGIDPLVEEQASSVAKAFADQRKFLLVTTKAKKPDMQSQTFMELLQDLQRDMGSVGDIRESNRASPLKEHLAMVGEGIGALQWLLMDGKPADFVGEIIGGAQMYGNRVLKAYKDTDPAHVKYVQSYYGLLKSLQSYVKKHYPTGVTWNNNGIDATQANQEASASSETPTNGNSALPPASSGAPPPPPPPLPKFDNIPGAPPPPPAGGVSKSAAPAGGDISAVFSQLNRGESVTSGLKKVDKSQMTHKNPSLRAANANGSPAPDSRSKSPGPDVKPKPPSMRQNSVASSVATTKVKAEPRKELDGNKWLIENFDSPGKPVDVQVALNQSLLITNCKNTTIILQGKANAISIDNSPRLQMLVENLVSSIDVIKSPNFAVQITGSLPTILLDQVDGASIYLGKESLHTEVFTSKCSSINIVLPPESDEDDSKECALPEQMRTFVRDGKLVSEIVEHSG